MFRILKFMGWLGAAAALAACAERPQSAAEDTVEAPSAMAGVDASDLG